MLQCHVSTKAQLPVKLLAGEGLRLALYCNSLLFQLKQFEEKFTSITTLK